MAELLNRPAFETFCEGEGYDIAKDSQGFYLHLEARMLWLGWREGRLDLAAAPAQGGGK